MPSSLPTDPAAARSLTGVVPNVLAALRGEDSWFAPATSAIVTVVDGLGAANLAARVGHARFLSAAGGRKDVARTVSPSTTAAALTSLWTATPPGVHGIVGYRVRIPGTDVVANQLTGWGAGGMDPLTWQRSRPVLDREAAEGRPCFVVSLPGHLGTGFTTAMLRGARVLGVADLAERGEVAAELAAANPGSLVYLYASELDVIGHRVGSESPEWSDALERVDAVARRLHERAPQGVGVVLTADHGMVDVPRHRHVLLGAGDALLDGVRLIGGEPRFLHLYAEDGAAEAVLRRWSETESTRSWVVSREEAIAAGLFGAEVDPAVRPRIGDVVVAARARAAYYDDRIAGDTAQNMVGQHGSLTDQERIVPLLRLGAFARGA